MELSSLPGRYLITILLLGAISVIHCRMNVLFLVADDMRPQLGAYYGKDFPSSVHPAMHTPNLDKLAARSLLLKRAHCQQSLCSPSRTSLLTGRRPDTTHVYDLKHYWRLVGGNFKTIPQYFKENEYISAGVGKVFHRGRSASGGDDPISWSVKYFHATNFGWETNQSSWQAIPKYMLKDKPLIDTQTADYAIDMIRRLAPSARSGYKPFFIAAGFQRPHLPFVFPESILRYYPEESIRLPDNEYAPVNMPDVAWSNYQELRKYHDIQKLNLSGEINSFVPVKVVKELRRAYYCAITYIDFLIGRVINELDVQGLTNNTIISFLGDHGWQLGEHGGWTKHTNFELSTHAPMIIHIPGMTDSGVVTEHLTEFVDLFPTLVDAAGLPAMPLCPENSSAVEFCREGSSLLQLITNPGKPWKTAAFSQYPRRWPHAKVMGYTIRTATFRYTEWVKFKYEPDYKPDWNTVFGVELYDHTNNHEENHNVASHPSYSEIKQKLSKLLHAGWRNLPQIIKRTITNKQQHQETHKREKKRRKRHKRRHKSKQKTTTKQQKKNSRHVNVIEGTFKRIW